MRTTSAILPGFIKLTGFEDERIPGDVWDTLVKNSSTQSVFQTKEYLKTWWEIFGRGELLLVGIFKDGIITGIAPFFTESGMVYLVGSGGSDYLDILGEVPGDSFDELLLFTSKLVNPFIGFVFYHLREKSKTTSKIKNSKWIIVNENKQVAPVLELKKFPEKAVESINKKSLNRAEKWFEKQDKITVYHLRDQKNILPLLEEFFDQHIERWSMTPYVSLFKNSKQKQFYKLLVKNLSPTGNLWFTAVKWQEKYIAFHFGFLFYNVFLWYKPSFDYSFAKHSPGEVLLKHLLQMSIHEDADVFDFGLGDEAFKSRFATSYETVFDWGIYPSQNKTK